MVPRAQGLFLLPPGLITRFCPHQRCLHVAAVWLATVDVVRVAAQLIKELAAEAFTRPLQWPLEFFIVHDGVAVGASKVIIKLSVGLQYYFSLVHPSEEAPAETCRVEAEEYSDLPSRNEP